MVDIIKKCFSEAHAAIRANTVVIWFPILFAVTVWVFYLLLFLILITPHVPNVLELDALTAWDSMAETAIPALGFLAAVAAIIYLVQASGTLGLRAMAVRGGKLETKDYFRSIRKYIIRVIGLKAIMLLLYAIPILFVAVLIVLGPWGGSIIGSDLETVFSMLSPFIAVSSLIMAAIHIAFAAWPLIMALEDTSLLASMKRSVALFRRNYRLLSSAILWGWAISLFSRMLLEGSATGQLLHTGWSFVITSYVSVTLMRMYLTLSKTDL